MKKPRRPRVTKKAPQQSAPQKAMDKASPAPETVLKSLYDEDMKECARKVKGKDAIISGKNAEIEALNKQLAEAKAKLKSAQTKDATISKLRNSNTKLKDENVALSKEVKARENNMANAEQDIKHFKEVADSYKRQIDRGNKRIAEFAEKGFFARAFTSGDTIKADLLV